MNRLVLIGNGFDMAHGLDTRYADFIDWYWEQRVDDLKRNYTNTSEDPLCTFMTNNPNATWNVYAWNLPRLLNKISGKDVIKSIIDNKTDFKVSFSPLFERIIKSVETKRWVDIENEYYELLTKDLRVRSINKIVPNAKDLNIHLGILREKLIDYLRLQNEKEIILRKDIKDKIYRPIERQEVMESKSKLTDDYYELSNVMLLNFNYTSTPERYMEGLSNVTINYIHGQLTNPESVIFGYGDELDKEFSRLKELNDNECLRYVKSIKYMEADNYRKLLEFIEAEPFQVVIMGHSCGNSDRTLLNKLFEHQNCVSIKPYYYINEQHKDNYLEIVQNIYRNFTDLQQMRAKVVVKPYTEPLLNAETDK